MFVACYSLDEKTYRDIVQKSACVNRTRFNLREPEMNTELNTLIAAMTAEEKVALLTGSGLWRTASLPQHGIEDIVMTDGTYGVRYSSAQIDGRRKMEHG
jgi:hypothetical protein